MNELTPMQQAIQIIEKVTKNLTDENQIKDLKAIANQFKTELLPKEKQVIEDAYTDGCCNWDSETDAQDYYNQKFRK